ncbi:MAG: hypothetical protein IAE87_18270 [Rhodobacteraceae bacterium]|jgi:hypothetical protein|nr:hypothetical protein [Paracoccaceae bacterium]
MTFGKIGAALALSVGVQFCGMQASAQTEEAYFEGKTVTLLVGFSPGGGTDLFGRAFADHLGRHLPGNPTVIVQNMPGAGGIIASNYFGEQAAKDGTYIMVGTGQLLMRLLLGLDGSTTEVEQLEPIVAGPMGRITYASNEFDLSDTNAIISSGELVVGVPEVISTIDAVLGLEVLGADFRAIVGYEGKSDTRLALERGEINVDEQTTPLFNTSVVPLIEEGKAAPLFAQGFLSGEELVRDPAAPDVPSLAEVYEQIHGKPPEGPAWEAYKASIRAIGNGGKILMIHSDLPDDVKADIHGAIEGLKADEEFQKAADQLLEGYDLNTGEALSQSIAAIAATDPATLEWLKTYLAENYDMTFN